MSRLMQARLSKLEAIRKPKPTLSAADEAWIRETTGNESEFLIPFVKSALSGEFAKGRFIVPGRVQA